MAELTYRDAVARGIAQEMARDERVVLIGEDVAGAGGVFKTTVGLLERFGPRRVVDTPISEQAILGAVMGAAMTGLRPIAEIMFGDFFAVCWDIIANQIAKTRYMTDGQVSLPLVIKTGNGAGLRFGAQHSQAVENWAMAIPGLKVVVPSTPRDVVGLMAAAVRSDDPVLVFEAKGLYPTKGDVEDGEIVDTLGTARIVRQGRDATILALGLMVPRALTAAEHLATRGIDAEVIDVRSLIPLDARTILESVAKTGRLFTVEENPRVLGWGAEIASIVAEEAFWDLDGPIQRITTPHIPLPSADSLEDLVLPSADVVATTVEKALQASRRSDGGGSSRTAEVEEDQSAAVVGAIAHTLLRGVRLQCPATDIEVTSGEHVVVIRDAHNLTCEAIVRRLAVLDGGVGSSTAVIGIDGLVNALITSDGVRLSAVGGARLDLAALAKSVS